MTRWVYLPCPRQILWFLVWVFLVVAPVLFVLFCCFSCWRNANLAGRFACRRCFAWFLFGVGFASYCGTKVFHIMFAIYLPASLIVRTEPQSEIGRNRGWAAVLTILHRWQKIAAMEFISRGVKIYQWDWDEPRRWWPASPFFARCDAALNVWNEMENRYIFHLLEPGFGDREICLTNCNMCWLKVL